MSKQKKNQEKVELEMKQREIEQRVKKNPFFNLMDPIFDEYAKVTEQVMEPVLAPICELGKELIAGAQGLLRAPLDEMERAFNEYSEDVKRDTKAALKATIEDPITELTKGLDNMLINFIRIVCFLNKTHCRLRNLFEAFDNLFQGIAEEFITLGQAIEMGFNSVTELVFYFGVFIGSYIACVGNLIVNFIPCLPFYIASIIGYILYLPIQITLWVCKTFISWDLYSTEKRIWKGLKTMNDTLFPILGFHFMHFPKWVRQNCYSCIRLKTSVMKEAKNETDNVFNKKIPELFTRERKFDKAFRHLEEVFAFPEARAPEDVE
tara:strand:- start:20323 stop:21285 length:963 start_codon:yes stop_codon:yes gene_type:complete